MVWFGPDIDTPNLVCHFGAQSNIAQGNPASPINERIRVMLDYLDAIDCPEVGQHWSDVAT